MLVGVSPAWADHDTYHTLRQCEGHVPGASEYHIGYYQFSPDTAAKVGIDGSESLEEQTAAAKSWASKVDPGSSAGWPNCWPGEASERPVSTPSRDEAVEVPVRATTAQPTRGEVLAVTG